MIRVGILMFQNMRYAPFLRMYENLLESMNSVEYDVIYYDRDRTLGEIQDLHHVALPWHGKGTLAAPKIEKMANFVFYAIDARKLLSKKKYDFVIVLTTFPSVLLANYLISNYRGRYLVDIRDYTQERFKPYFDLESKAFSNAAMCVISSPGFVNFLPVQQYYNCHNIDANATKMERPHFVKACSRRIIISYIGSVSYETQCKQLIDLVVRDERFEFHLYGNEANGTEVSEYVLEKDCPRVKMMGSFMPKDKPKIYGSSDLVFNCYGNDRMLVKYAISNKYYDGAIFRKPLLVSPNTSMAELSGDGEFDLDLDKISDLEELYQWYENLDERKYICFADRLLEIAIEQNKNLLTKIESCITKSGRK